MPSDGVEACLLTRRGRVQPIRLLNAVFVPLFQADSEITPVNEYLPGVFPTGKGFDEREQRRRRARDLARRPSGFHGRHAFRAGKIAQHSLVI